MTVLLAASGAGSGLLAPSPAKPCFLIVSMKEGLNFKHVADDPSVYLSELDLIRAGGRGEGSSRQGLCNT